MSEAMEMWLKSPMLVGEEKGLDVDTFKRFYEVWEKATSEAMEMWLKSPLFAASAGKAVEKSAEFKKYIDDIIERTLKNMHLSTKGDVGRVLASLNNLESRVNDLAEKIDELQPKESRKRSKKSGGEEE